MLRSIEASLKILAEAAQRATPEAPRKFQETKPGRMLTAILYGLVGVMGIACLAFAGAIAKRFDLFGALLR